MTTPSHLCFGATCGLILASFIGGYTPHQGYAEIVIDTGALAFGTLLPDIDSPSSIISRAFPPARALHRRFPHRSLPHSLLGLGIATFAVYLFIQCICLVIGTPMSSILPAYFATGFVSHLVADCFTVRGIKFLYPYPVSFAYPTIERYRLRTGYLQHEITFSVISIIIGVLYLPVVFQGGATATLHNVLATVRSAYEEYQSSAGIEKVLAFKGYESITKYPISGRALILDATPEQFIVFFNGKVLTIGEIRGDIIATAARCIPTTTPVSTSSHTVTSERWSNIISSLPANALISGDLTADYAFAVKNDLQSRNVAVVESKTLRLTYALPRDLSHLHIQPHTNLEELTAERLALRQSLAHTEQALQDTIVVRGHEKDAYRRDQLFARITSLRREITSTTARIDRLNRDIQAAQSIRVRFSGTLAVRPVFVENPR